MPIYSMDNIYQQREVDMPDKRVVWASEGHRKSDQVITCHYSA